MSTYNICSCGEIIKVFIWLYFLGGALNMSRKIRKIKKDKSWFGKFAILLFLHPGI